MFWTVSYPAPDENQRNIVDVRHSVASCLKRCMAFGDMFHGVRQHAREFSLPVRFNKQSSGNEYVSAGQTAGLV